MPRMARRSPRVIANQQRIRRENARNDLLLYESMVAEFENEMRIMCFRTCQLCKKRFEVDSKVGPRLQCASCHRTGQSLFIDNSMDIGDIPPELQGLTLIEQVLIARVHPMISLFKIRNQQRGYSGHVINFNQHVEQIATRLPPHLEQVSSLIILNRGTPDGIVQFRVRAAKVRAALYWLKANNQYYSDLFIDEEALRNLPADGDVADLMPNVNAEEESDERDGRATQSTHQGGASIPTQSASEAGVSISTQSASEAGASISTQSANEGPLENQEPSNQFDRSVYPRIDPIDQGSVITENLRRAHFVNQEMAEWPDISQRPLHELRSEGMVCRAFPCLFPYGLGDLNAPRERRIDARKYFQYLMLYKDGRFARDERFPYYAYNTIARWDAINCGTVYHRLNNMEGITGEDLEMMANDPHHNLAASIMYYGASIRGTRAYWRQRCSELVQMVKQMGIPTLFFTLSAADYHWPDLFRILLGHDASAERINTLSEKERRELMHADPLTVAWFFDIRCRVFMEKFMKRIFKIKEFWYRYEWQHRGSPHIHGLLWLDAAPDCLDIDALTEEERREVITYFDRHVSASIGHIYDGIHPTNNPCRRRYCDLSVTERRSDLDKLLSAVQRHTRHGDYCLRKKRGSNTRVCRFGFPIPVETESALRKENGIWKFFPKRNDSLLQRFNRFLTQAWRGNTDCSAITSKDGVLNYIAKYASKGEQPSESYSDILKRILERNAPDTAAVTLIRQLLVSSVAERNFPCQEVMHLLLGWPLFHASRTFVVLSLNDEWRPLDRRSSNMVGFYARRPNDPELDMLTLFKFAVEYRVENQRVKKRRRECVVRVIPFVKLSDDPDEREKYFEVQSKLHIPWRNNFNDLKPADSTWEEFYIENQLNQVGPEAFADEFPHQPEELSYEMEPEDPEAIVRDAGMAASRMGPIIGRNEPLGHRPIDEAELWPTFETLASITEDSIKQYLRSYDENLVVVRSGGRVIHYGDMSREQRVILDICDQQLDNPAYAERKRVLVQGKAGTGKSEVIRALRSKLEQRQALGQHGSKIYVILAPTGAAAVNIDGKTLHSALRIPVSGRMMPLNGENLRTLQRDFADVRFIIIDEYSMIGLRLLCKVNQRLQEAKHNAQEPFGGCFVYLFGDVNQLPPVRDLAIYQEAPERDDDAQYGADIVNSIQKFIILTVCHRQSGDQQSFRDALDHIAVGEVRREDWQLLISRRREINQGEMQTFADAVRLFPTNSQVLDYNLEKLSETGHAVAVIEASHNNSTARQGSEVLAQGLSAKLYLTKGCRIMLRRNLCVRRGLVNGSLGTVREIIYRAGERPPLLPYAILIEFDKFTGPYYSENLFPLLPITNTWRDQNVECSRRQFPISLAYAMTIHKSQGLTLDRVVIDIGLKEASVGLSYVAFSRVRRLTDLIVNEGFNYDRLENLKKLKHIGLRKMFYSKIASRSRH